MQVLESLKRVVVPIHRDGWPFVVLFALGTLVLFLIAEPLGWIGALLTAWCAYFFRDPDRVTPTASNLVISPADGVVEQITQAAPPDELGLDDPGMTRVSIFMSVFNVHVNRVPCSGKVEAVAYHPGKFLNASLDKASDENERMSILINANSGPELAVVQIAGLVARRIRCDLHEGQTVQSGERFGLIRFGSRLDVYLPPACTPLVSVGQTMIAGETVIADLKAGEGDAPSGREAVIR